MPEIIIDRGETEADKGPGVRLLTLTGLAVVTTMFGGLIAWSNLAPLESAAPATPPAP